MNSISSNVNILKIFLVTFLIAGFPRNKTGLFNNKP